MCRSIMLAVLAGLALSSAGPRTASGAEAKAWALVIGVGRYPRIKGEIYDCPNAVADARAVAAWLTTTAGWPADRVRLMTSDLAPGSPDRPTLVNLRSAVTNWLGKNVGRDDLVFLYFAGQLFSRLEADPRARLDAPLDFLLPVDFEFDEGDRFGWALDRDLERFRGKDVQVFCCLDTSTAGRKGGIARRVTPADRLLRALACWPGWASWIAADEGQVAPDVDGDREGSPLRHRLIRALGTGGRRNNMRTCLNALKGDEDLVGSRFRTEGVLRAGLTLWSGKVEAVEDLGLRPVLQKGHAGPVQAVVAGLDGESFLSASEDSTVRIWRTGGEAGAAPVLGRTLAEPIGGVSCLAISPDGKWIAAGSLRRNDVWLWDGEGSPERLDLAGARHRSERPIKSIGFLANSRGFVTVNAEGEAHYWDVATRRPDLRIDGVNDAARDAVAFAAAPEGAASVAVAALAFDVTGDGVVRLLGVDGQRRGNIPSPCPRPSSLDLSRDGGSLAVANERGACVVLDVSDPDRREPPATSRYQLDGEKVACLRLQGRRWLAVGTNRNLWLIDRSKGGPSPTVAPLVPGRVSRVAFSVDGRLLAAIVKDEGGPRARLWRLEGASPTEVDLGGRAEPEGAPSVLAFSGQGRELVAGGLDGSIRSWKLDDARARVANLRTVRPDAGRIRSISPAPDARRFVRLCQDGRAFLFDFGRRASTPLKHRWNSIGFLADGRLVGTIDHVEPSIPEPIRPLYLGGPVEYDLDRDRVEPGAFLPPDRADPATLRLDRMAASADGDWIGVDRSPAGADRREVLLWKRSGGKPLPALGTEKGLDRLAFALAPSGGAVVVCSRDGATLHDGPGPARRLAIGDLLATRPRRVVEDHEFTAAAFAPPRGGAKPEPRLIALGSKRLGVVLWSPDAGGDDAVRVLGGTFDVEVRTLTFVSTADGVWLIASGSEKSFRAWWMDGPKKFEEIKMEPNGPHHDGEIRDVRAWPGQSMIATTGDDATVRFWSLTRRQLIGTLAFGPVEPADGLNWVAYSPDGRFDCPPGGKDLLKLVRRGRPIPVALASGPLMDDHLIDRLRTAEVAAPRSGPEPPPGLALRVISPLGEGRTSPDPAVWLELQLDFADPQGLRLYRNEVPIRGLDGFEKTEDPYRYRSRVALRNGINTFRAVAARGQSIEGSSSAVPVAYKGADDPSRVHVLAIGIDKYARQGQRLRYAVRDARDFSQRLADLDAVNGKMAEAPTLLRVDDEVDEESVKQAFAQLRDRVKGRPNDKVVIFLAGHTDQYGEDFGLLLSKPRPGSSSILRYSTILQGLARLDAEHRLVVVDACQTDKILSGAMARDFARAEARAIDRHALKYPTQYILASKSGEPALENRELEHGLLTYALLCGLGPGEVPARLKGNPEGVAAFSRPADDDGDGAVTTDELNKYAATRLPLLLAAYQDPAAIPRGRIEDEPGRRAQREADRPRVGSDPTLASFELVKLRIVAP